MRISWVLQRTCWDLLPVLFFSCVEKQSKFVRFHAMQSTILYGGIFIINIALGFIPIIGWLAGLILSFVAFILWIVCMWKAFQGEMYKVPYVGNIAEQQLAKMK